MRTVTVTDEWSQLVTKLQPWAWSVLVDDQRCCSPLSLSHLLVEAVDLVLQRRAGRLDLGVAGLGLQHHQPQPGQCCRWALTDNMGLVST